MGSSTGSWTPGEDCSACGTPDDECNLNLEVGDRTPCCADCRHPAVARATPHTWDRGAVEARQCVVCRFPEEALELAGLGTSCLPGLAALHHAAHAEGRAAGIREERARTSTASSAR